MTKGYVAATCACGHAKGDHRSSGSLSLIVTFGRCLIPECDCTVFTVDTGFPLDTFKPQDGQYLLTPKVAYLTEGILAGDSLIVRAIDTAEAGQLVVVSSSGEASVVRLEADEPRQVMGLVIAVMRRLT